MPLGLARWAERNKLVAVVTGLGLSGRKIDYDVASDGNRCLVLRRGSENAGWSIHVAANSTTPPASAVYPLGGYLLGTRRFSEG